MSAALPRWLDSGVKYEEVVDAKVPRKLRKGPLGAEVTLEGTAMVIYRFGEEVKAFDARCPHAGSRMRYADIEDCLSDVCIVCPAHGYRFSFHSGEGQGPQYVPCTGIWPTVPHQHGARMMLPDGFTLPAAAEGASAGAAATEGAATVSPLVAAVAAAEAAAAAHAAPCSGNGNALRTWPCRVTAEGMVQIGL